MCVYRHRDKLQNRLISIFGVSYMYCWHPGVNFNGQMCLCPQVSYNDHPRPVLHVWEDRGQQVGGIPWPTSSRVY